MICPLGTALLLYKLDWLAPVTETGNPLMHFILAHNIYNSLSLSLSLSLFVCVVFRT